MFRVRYIRSTTGLSITGRLFFQDIIDNLLDNNSQISISDTDAVNKAINHYLEYDDFLY